MMKFTIACFAVLISVSTVFATPKPNLDWAKKVGAKTFPSSKKTYNVKDFGAKNDSSFLSTQYIQKAIDECAEKGGGSVVFEKGFYQTGAIFIKSNVNLKIEKGTIILGSQHFEDYPEIDTRIAGIEMKWPAALFNIIKQKNAALTGNGIVNARGKFCWDKYWAMRKEYEAKGLRWIVDYDAKRVRTLLVQSSSDITIKSLTFKNAGFWTCQILYSKQVTVDKITVRNNDEGKGPSTDGVDVDSSTWVLIQNCDIDCNDDDFCLKSGRDWDGLRVNKPTEYVVIRNCLARKGGGLLTLGSETSGGIRHVLAENLVGKGTGNGFQIKSATTRGGTIDDINFRNNVLDSVTTAFQITMNWNPSYSYSTLPAGYNKDSIPAHWKVMLKHVEPAEKGTPHFKNVYISNITASGIKKIFNASGMESSKLDNFQFDNIHISAAAAGEISYAKDWQFKDVQLKNTDGKDLNIKNSDPFIIRR